MDITSRRGINVSRAFLAFLATVSLALGANLLMPAKPANAWNSLGCKWGTSSINLRAPAPLLSYPNWDVGAKRWNGLDAKYRVNGTGTVHVYATNEARGNTVAWTGIARKKGTVSGYPTCTSGRWVAGQMEVVLNWSLVKDYSSTKRSGVAAHELGHSFGLAHNDARANILMYPYDSRTVTSPSSDDKAGVNALY